MVNIVRSENGNQGKAPAGYVAPSSATEAPTEPAEHRRALAVNGRAIDYTDREFDIPQAWNLLSPKMRVWATERAGDAIADPVTRKRRCYKWADVSRTGESWDDGTSSAEYALVMFGKRGLVVAYGLTDDLVTEPGATSWRTSRWDMPIDSGNIRHDHRSGVPGNTGGSSSGGSTDASTGDVSGLLDDDTAANLGNLPTETQSFLLEPFVRSGSAPQDGGVQALRSLAGRHVTEELWVYLFNGRWVSFSYARRSAPQRQRRNGADGLTGVPWDLAAWVAPVIRTDRPELTP